MQAREQETVRRIVAQQALLERAPSAEAERDRLAKAAADQAVALHALAEHARCLAALAAAGRVALDVGVRLCDLVQDIDARATRVLARCPLDAPDRADRELVQDRKSTRLNSSHIQKSRMPSSA